MTLLTRWDPFREFITLQDRMNRLLRDPRGPEGQDESLTENNTLTVHGERKFETDEKEENYRRVERQYGSFTRTFTLPNTVDQESVQADYDKGVLKIKLAKKEEAKPKQIKVNVNSEKQGTQKTLESKGPSKVA